ncbi:hypothetical protein ACJVC5_16795 [Peredibacter sp. HCB2-198]|uniref:hypothetical protein n=1 Tax=Peredibacter sp. HCB2-198 TaxID=3383025 RepID=UPI0038B53375
MKSFKQGLLAIALTVAYPVMACTPDGTEGFVPENNVKIYANQKGRMGGLTEQQFNDVITKVETLYAPIISNFGANLQVERNWDDPTVNAYAQQMGKTWKVSMFGGLARHETITEDGFALVVCHELGHHIGGAPRKTSQWASSWASNEGQADYFATLKCLRKVWLNDDNQAIVRQMMPVPATLRRACSSAHTWSDDYYMCIRGGMAGMSVSRLFMALRNSTVEPKFDTPDTKVVTRTDDNHPAYQCRLDTYFQGALCDKSMNEDVSASSEVTGTCHGTLGDKVGLRPLCWFKPSVSSR